MNLLTLGAGDHGPTLLALHGGPGMDYSYFLPYLMPLTTHCRLALYVQGTHGAQHMEGVLAELDDAFDTIGRPCFVFGHSFGAALLLEYLRHHPRRPLAGIILSSWMHDASWIAHYAARFPADAHTEAPYTSDAQYRAATVALADRYFTTPFCAEGRRLLQQIRYSATLSNAIGRDFFAAYDGKSIIRALQTPTMSLTGQHDHIVDVAHVRAGVRLSTRISAHELPHVGHFPFVENATACNRLILDFMTGSTQVPEGNR